jgi:hypothetical protein
VNAFRREGEGLNYAVAVDVVKEFLQEEGGRTQTVSAPRPSVPAYRMEVLTPNIVGIYVDTNVPPPDVWFVYRDASRRELAYALKADATTGRINTVIQPPDAQHEPFTYYFDTNYDGLIDLIGYSVAKGGIERYDKPQTSLTIAMLAKEFIQAVQAGKSHFPQLQGCP